MKTERLWFQYYVLMKDFWFFLSTLETIINAMAHLHLQDLAQTKPHRACSDKHSSRAAVPFLEGLPVKQVQLRPQDSLEVQVGTLTNSHILGDNFS